MSCFAKKKHLVLFKVLIGMTNIINMSLVLKLVKLLLQYSTPGDGRGGSQLEFKSTASFRTTAWSVSFYLPNGFIVKDENVTYAPCRVSHFYLIQECNCLN